MPKLRLLPIGTVFKPKGLEPGWERMRLMITGYFPIESDHSSCEDYLVTPWPLGYVNYENGTQEIFFGGDESGIEEIEFLGAVDDRCEERIDSIYSEALGLDELTSPLASGGESIVGSYGDLPCTIRDIPFAEDELLPLGTVISTARNGSQKGMIYQNQTMHNGVRYDYGVCSWPEGADPGRGEVQLIKHDQITAVHFRGYENALSRELAKSLEKKRRGSLFTRLFG